MKFRDSKLAHEYCIGHGLEIGPSTHNPFNLSDCLMLVCPERLEFWQTSEIKTCGEATNADLYGYADSIPIEDNSLDYILSSHVIEHVPNPIKAFFEWDKKLKSGGIIFMIFPKYYADPKDITRPISSLQSFIDQYNSPQPLSDEIRHIWVFSLKSMINLFNYCTTELGLGWDIILTKETDDKVGNGHCIILKKH